MRTKLEIVTRTQTKELLSVQLSLLTMMLGTLGLAAALVTVLLLLPARSVAVRRSV